MFFLRVTESRFTTKALVFTALLGLLLTAASAQAAAPSKDAEVKLSGPLVYHLVHYCSIVNVSGHALTNVAVKFTDAAGVVRDSITHSSMTAGQAAGLDTGNSLREYLYCTVSFSGQPGDVRVAHCGFDDDNSWNDPPGVGTVIGQSCMPVN